MTEFVTIEVNGYKLLVYEDGEIRLPKKETTFTFVRLGKTETRTAVFKERVLKPCKTQSGYMEVCFVHKHKTHKHLVHRLVAKAFVPGYADGLVVNHKNGDKLDNRPTNLEWVTKGRNSQHAWEMNLIPLRGEDNPLAKLSAKRVAHIRKLLEQGASAYSLAVIADVSDALIYKIARGKAWPHVPAEP